MFFSAACSVRNGSRFPCGVAALTVFARRTLHGAVKSHHQTRALHLHQLQLKPHALTTVPARALSISGVGPRVKVAPDEAKEPEDSEEGRGFGSLSASLSSRRSYRKTSPDLENLRYSEEAEEEQGEAPQRVRRRKRENTPYWYFLQCKKLIKENKLEEALDLFSIDMLQAEMLKPEEFNYTVLIGGCGRAGQLKKAFRLYNDLKKRGLEPSDATYTALFNACAECPSTAAGLKNALKLEQELHRKNLTISTITYHALLKVHAVTNNLQACLHTLREMLQNGHVVTQETFHYLLMGCIKDKDSGFRMALQIWRQMLKSGILPDSKNYTLLLRAARDCKIGDQALASAILLQPVEVLKRKTKKRPALPGNMLDIDAMEKQLFQSEPHNSVSSFTQEAALVQIPDHHTDSPPAITEQGPDSPNLLDLFEGRNAGVVSLCAVESTSDRLALIGGAQGFLKNMERRGLKPELKTLTLLADTAEPDRDTLKLLLRAAKTHQLKLDVTFFNSVIRRAARAGDMETAQAVLSVMRERHVGVDMKTFGSMALGCKREKDALLLLNNMEECGAMPNVHVFSAMIGCAARRLDYIYLKKLLTLMMEKEVWPNKVIIQQLEFAAQYPPNYDQYKRRNNYLVHIDGFRGYYQQWLRSMPAQTEEQMQTESLQIIHDRENESTQAQKNQRAAARRFHSRNWKKTSSSTGTAV